MPARSGNTLAPAINGTEIASNREKLVVKAGRASLEQNSSVTAGVTADGPQDHTDPETGHDPRTATLELVARARTMVEKMAGTGPEVEKFMAAFCQRLDDVIGTRRPGQTAASEPTSASSPAMDWAGFASRFPDVRPMRVLGGSVVRAL
jgi:hypothetical protein